MFLRLGNVPVYEAAGVLLMVYSSSWSKVLYRNSGLNPDTAVGFVGQVSRLRPNKMRLPLAPNTEPEDTVQVNRSSASPVPRALLRFVTPSESGSAALGSAMVNAPLGSPVAADTGIAITTMESAQKHSTAKKIRNQREGEKPIAIILIVCPISLV